MIKKILILVFPLILLSNISTAITVNHDHMEITLPNESIKSITTFNNMVGVTIGNDKLMMFFMEKLDPSHLQKPLHCPGFPTGIPPYGDSFLQAWKKSTKEKVEHVAYVQSFPNQNGLITILTSKEHGYYIWCNYVKDGYLFGITSPSSDSLSDSINQAILLFNSIRHITYF